MWKLLTIALWCTQIAWVQKTLAQRPWLWQNPLPQGNSLNAVSFIDTLTATAVGDAGTILRTTDGGITWLLQSHSQVQRMPCLLERPVLSFTVLMVVSVGLSVRTVHGRFYSILLSRMLMLQSPLEATVQFFARRMPGIPGRCSFSP